MIYVYKSVQIDTKKLLFCVTKILDLGQKWSHFSEKGISVPWSLSDVPLQEKINQKPIIWNKTGFYCETTQQGFRLIMGPPCETNEKVLGLI